MLSFCKKYFMKIFVAADHAGFVFRAKVIKYLTQKGHEVIDLGNDVYDRHDDYPKFAQKLAKEIIKDKKALGVLICGSAQGMAMAANRYRGVQAAVGLDKKSIIMARQDEGANVLSLAAGIITFPKTKPIIDAWLETKPSSAKRHLRRLSQY